MNGLENLCGKFKFLYDLIFVSFGEYASRNNENSEYINYWLNKQLKSKRTLNISAPVFYKKIITNDMFFDEQKKLIPQKIHDIEEEHLKKMNILYDLNTIYHNIKFTPYNDEEKCNSHSDECVQKFREAIESCSTSKNDKYCEALKSFKNKYEEYNGDDTFGGCNKKYLSKLPLLTEENKHSAILNEPAADTRQLESHPEKIKDQDLGIQGDLEKERQKSTNLMQPPFSPAGEDNNDNNISIFTIFGIILSISVFSTITYKVKYVTYKNNNI
ncbi:hypothetical protein PVIIG_06148 [Plasmodium vivax India VII]|uniref:Uncharacterized protein n=1 Tax=Plasmodium vivax India VII TaxID=1077284 RepID=A0A0J9S2H1_PLAVI|nr:hypothetical protein PVIIG_06148 [Plasmodium vivax India VII]